MVRPSRGGTSLAVPVAAGVLFNNGRVLAAQRSVADRHPLKWEFPGGKVEPGEDARRALMRELREELDVEATVGKMLRRSTHRYPDGLCVDITFIHVTAIDREPTNQVFADLRWVLIEELHVLDFLAGDRAFVGALESGAVTPKPTMHGSRKQDALPGCA